MFIGAVGFRFAGHWGRKRVGWRLTQDGSSDGVCRHERRPVGVRPRETNGCSGRRGFEPTVQHVLFSFVWYRQIPKQTSRHHHQAVERPGQKRIPPRAKRDTRQPRNTPWHSTQHPDLLISLEVIDPCLRLRLHPMRKGSGTTSCVLADTYES